MSIDTTVNTIGGAPRAASGSTGFSDPEPEQRQKYPIFRSIFFSLLALIGLGVVAGIVIAMNQEEETQRRPFTPLGVQADYARMDSVLLSVQTQGEARPRTEIDLVPQVGGKIVYVSPNFIEGGIFKRGETLVRIDPADYNVAVIRAEAQVAQAEQVLAREIAEGEIARQDYEELGRGEPSPLALRLPQRQQAEAALTAARADLENAKLQLTRTSVVAPFSGRVRSKASDVGQFVNPGARLGQIFSTDIIEVRLPLTDDNLSKLDLPLAYVADSRETAPVVTLSTVIAGQYQEWDARIMRTDAAYDTQTRALFAIAEVQDPYGDGASQNGVPLAPGLFVDAAISGRRLDNVIVIPRDGLRVGDEVYVVNDKGKASIRSVSVLDASPSRAVLRSGVEAGELVVLSPMERSRVSLPLQVLDVNDPSVVLVEPEEPEWMKREREAQGKKGRRGERQKDADTETSDDADGEGDNSESASAGGSSE
jgi:RND family efflux transporter MFP subunit